jgi:hypothetical protein
MKDWLQLLDMRIQGSTGYFFRWPLPRANSGFYRIFFPLAVAAQECAGAE